MSVFILLLSHVDQQAQASDLDEITVIATRSELPISDQSTSLSLLSNRTLELTDAIHIQQALAQVPGVSMHRGEGQESLPAIRSAVQTGAGACGSVLVMEETIPVRGAGFCNVNELFDTHFEHAERIEVLRGANTSFYGSNALNGSVNVHLAAQGESTLGLGVGPYGYRRAKAAFDTGIGRLYLTQSDDDGYRDDSGYTQNKLSWRYASEFADWDIRAGLTYTDLDQETAGFITGIDSYLDREIARSNLNPEAFRDTQSLRLWMSAEKQLSENSSLQTTVYARDTEMDFLLHFLPGDPLEQNAQSGLGFQSAWRTRVNDELKLVIGIDGDFSDGELKQTQANPTQGSAFLQATIPTGVQYDYQVDAEQLASFAHLQWSLSDQWHASFGLRWERTKYDYDNLALDGRTRDDGTTCGFGGCRYSRPSDRSDSFSHVSPKLEIAYSPNKQTRYSLRISDSFRAPQATELYRLQRAQQVAELDIVEARSIELGLRHEVETFSLSATLFDTQTKNLIFRDTDFFNVSGQEVDSKGVELGMKFEFRGDVSLSLASSYAEHKIGSDQLINGRNIRGNYVDTAPRLFGNIQVDWLYAADSRIQLELAHTSRYFLEPNNDFQYPGHTLFNLRANHQWSDRWQSGIRVLNLGNRRYAERADYTSFTEQRYFPGLPRAIYADLSYTF